MATLSELTGGRFEGIKFPAVAWLDAPEEHDYEAAGQYLSLIDDPVHGRTHDIITRLRRATTVQYHAKDLLRASELPLLPVDNKHVAKDLNKIADMKPLSPILLIRGRAPLASSTRASGPLVIADGYHRVCAAWHASENALVSCRIVT